ncbi:hypothetical protein [Polaribacter aestuariivivens]|uniref:hypothetical protein n=1 Tax=Polaribacter aestuariivivens TaxID=2304626 RepID=UPI003F49A89A
MMTKKILFLSVVAVVFGSSFMFSQVKFEKEYRLKTADVPKKALHIVTMWDFKKKVKWYAEESQDGKTVEGKVCHNRHKISLEFKENGTLIDVEKTVKFSDLEEDIQKNIENTLSKKFKKFRFKKVQIQFIGDESAIYNEIFNIKSRHEKIIPKYEIIVKGKKEKRYQNFEFLFNRTGEIEKELLIKSSDSTNLEF